MADPATLTALLERLVAERRDEPWIADRAGVLSAREFADRVASMAAALVRSGVKPADRVGAWLEHGIDLAAVPFASARVGVVSVLLNPKLRDDQVRHVVEDADVACVLTSATKSAALRDEGRAFARRPSIRVEDIGPGSCAAAPVEPGEPATILYTSGSTGRPKGIVQSHRSLCDGARIVAGYLALRREDHVLGVLPLSFDYGLNQVLASAWSGARVTLHGYFTAKELVRALATSGATGLAGVPELWVELVDALDRGVPEELRLRYVTNSGGRLPLRVIEWFAERMPEVEVFSMYGLTEAFRSSFVPPGELRARPRSIGKAIPEVELLVVDPETGRECAPGEVGELVHAGALVADGYWRRPEETRARFRPHPVRGPAGGTVVFSGDLVRKDADGWLELVGRADSQLKIGGFRVSPDEVVDVVTRVEGVRTAAATAVPRGVDGIPALVVAVVPAGETDPELVRSAAVETCRTQLPSYLVPAEVRLVDALPLGANHKVDHAALRAMFEEKEA